MSDIELYKLSPLEEIKEASISSVQTTLEIEETKSSLKRAKIELLQMLYRTLQSIFKI